MPSSTPQSIIARTAARAAAGFALAALAAAAQAQSVVCESHNGRFNECSLPFAAQPVLQEVMSSADCVQGRSWGSRWPGSVWVSNGCRARFGAASGQFAHPVGNQALAAHGGLRDLSRESSEFGNAYQSGAASYVLRCESENNRPRQCRAPVGGRLVLLRQLSDAACVENRTWGHAGNGLIWVAGGCRGEFGPAGTIYDGHAARSYTEPPTQGTWVQGQGLPVQTITCSSQNGAYRQCAWNASQGWPHLVEQLSSQPCREGQNWGYSSRGFVWVNQGCRARFSSR